jgi:hypothetical protein
LKAVPVKIDTAYLCSECQEIQTGAPKGACFSCGSQGIFPLSWLLRKRSERAKWVKMVSGGKRSRDEQFERVRKTPYRAVF